MKSFVFCAVFGFCLVALALAGPVVDEGHIKNSVNTNEYSNVEEALMKKLNTKCSNRDVSSCMMLKLVTYFNKLMKKSSLEFGDVEISQTTDVVVSKDSSARSLNDFESMSEDSQVGEVIVDKLWNFVRSRSLKWKINEDSKLVLNGENMGVSVEDTPSSNSVGEARKKNKGGMGPIIAAVVLKVGLLKALAFKALVLLVGKAVLVSKLALVLALIIALKKLLSHEKHVTYEVVAHPTHEQHHEHSFSSGGHEAYGGGGHGGWGRTLDAAELAYSAHKPTA